MEDSKMEYLLKKIDSCEDKNERLLLNTILLDVKKCKHYKNEIDQLSVEAFKSRSEEKYNIGCSIMIGKEEYTVKAVSWCDTERSHICLISSVKTLSTGKPLEFWIREDSI